MKLHKLVFNWAVNFSGKRAPNVIIGPTDRPYLHRWYVIPRNRFLNIYIHQFMRSDDDRALHDHPWFNASWILDGGYWEIVPKERPVKHGARFQTDTLVRKVGSVSFRRATQAHRIVLFPRLVEEGAPIQERRVWTLFITGPKIREWGFSAPKGWVHWENFVHHERSADGTLLSTYAGDR